MSFHTIEQIRSLLEQYQPPQFTQPLQAARAISRVEEKNGVVTIQLTFGFPSVDHYATLQHAVHALLTQHFPQVVFNITCTLQIKSHQVQNNLKPIAGVKNIIAVGSGKGGVGKSTTALNLALALQQLGARVGLLDADIYGPNQPSMLGIHTRPEADDNNHMLPVMQYELQTMSIGYLIDNDKPAIWRGPMVTKALQQLLFETKWHDLDYLILDLPPGTGDVQLTLAQKIPVSGAVIVTTPQTVACEDALKGLLMFNKVGVSVLGVIENMSGHTCSHCGHQEATFGSAGGAALAHKAEVPLLGQVPLDISIREQTCAGLPVVLAAPTSAASQCYKQLASRLALELSWRPVNYTAKFPPIVVENR